MTRMREVVNLLDIQGNERGNLMEIKGKEKRGKVTRTDKYGRR
jgi:hypothetical protein